MEEHVGVMPDGTDPASNAPSSGIAVSCRAVPGDQEEP